MPRLVVHQDGDKREYQLGTQPVTIGRGPSNTVTLDDHRSSREHARIEREGDKWFVVDLESSNGTYLDGRKVTRQELSHGVLIRIGKARISFLEGEAPAPEPTAAPDGVDLSLRAIGGPCDGQVFNIEKPVTAIGRHPDNDIVLNESAVSAEHAKIVIEDDRATIIDRNSRNGIRVGQERVEQHHLKNGDTVGIASTTFEVVMMGIGVATAPADLPEEPPAPDAAQPPPPQPPEEKPKTGLAAVFTPRVKIAAAVVAAILLLSLLLDLLTPAAPTHTVYNDNLLNRGNPSFEVIEAQRIPGWIPARGKVGVDAKNVADGAACLKLVADPRAGGDISALCWSLPVTIEPRTRYEFSALVRNSGSESVALCARWECDKPDWLHSLQLGRHQTDEALDWQRITEELVPPSWASSMRIGCAVVGQGAAKFDGVRLRLAGTVAPSARVTAGRLIVEPGQRGEFVVYADDTPLFGRGRAAVVTAGRTLRQSVGVLADGSPQSTSRMIKHLGKLGLEGTLPFHQVISSTGARASVLYEVDVAGTPDALVTIEMASGGQLFNSPVMVLTSRGARSNESGPFESRPGVTQMTFFTGSRRVFLEFAQPTNVTATRVRKNALAWRLEVPATGGQQVTVQMIWSATTPELENLVKSELTRAGRAADDEEFGKAISVYQGFDRKFPLYVTERAVAAKRLAGLLDSIGKKVKQVENLIRRARISQRDDDYQAAANECQKLLAKLTGVDSSKNLAKELAAIKLEHKAALKRQTAREATSRLDEARQSIARKQYTVARSQLKYVIDHFPNTNFADQARGLLDDLPKPD